MQLINPVHFFQACPVCGRSLRIRVGLLGRRVYCCHCDGSFTAADSNLASRGGPRLRPLEPLTAEESRASDARVEELLELASRRLNDAGCDDGGLTAAGTRGE